jgi:hypothetical protein
MLKRSPAKKKGAAAEGVQAKANKAATQKKPAAAPKGELGKGGATRAPMWVASKGIASVRDALVAYFRDVFVPSSEFKATFGGRSWGDIREEVLADIARFGLDADGEIVREANGSATYIGRVWGLHTEVSVQPGDEPSVFVEID